MFRIEGEPQEVLAARERVLTEFADLVFQEEGHLYFLNGKQLPSVSTIGHRFESHPFDKEWQAARMAERKGNTPEHYLKLWRECGGEILTVGSDAHNTADLGAGIREGMELARECGFRYIAYFRERKPQFVSL